MLGVIVACHFIWVCMGIVSFIDLVSCSVRLCGWWAFENYSEMEGLSN
jgi:hypothetical protein